MIRLLTVLLCLAGVFLPLWAAGAVFAGQTLAAFGIGFAGVLLSLLMVAQLPKPPELPRPYKPGQHEVIFSVGQYYGLAAIVSGGAAIVIVSMLLLPMNGLRPELAARVFSCAGALVGLSAFIALSARKWVEPSKSGALQ